MHYGSLISFVEFETTNPAQSKDFRQNMNTFENDVKKSTQAQLEMLRR